MNNNLKKEEKQIIALIIGFIAVIVIWLIIEFISQFGGLEVLTPVNFVRGFIRAGSVFFIFFFARSLGWVLVSREQRVLFALGHSRVCHYDL